LLTLLCIFTS